MLQIDWQHIRWACDACCLTYLACCVELCFIMGDKSRFCFSGILHLKFLYETIVISAGFSCSGHVSVQGFCCSFSMLAACNISSSFFLICICAHVQILFSSRKGKCMASHRMTFDQQQMWWDASLYQIKFGGGIGSVTSIETVQVFLVWVYLVMKLSSIKDF